MPIVIGILTCLGLSTLRIFIAWEMLFLFLVWNLFLAWIPFKIAQHIHPQQKWYVRTVLMALSILFLPNAAYLITDFVHFRLSVHTDTMWFDLILFFAYGLTGLLLTFKTVRILIHQLTMWFGSRISKAFALTIFPLIGFGIYLGRVERYNSWDALLHPLQFSSYLWHLAWSPERWIVFKFVLISTLFGWATHLMFHGLSQES
jgi:uncharacterized membrane protein